MGRLHDIAAAMAGLVAAVASFPAWANFARSCDVAGPAMVAMLGHRFDLVMPLAPVTTPRYEVVIVDNASTVRTVDQLAQVSGACIVSNPRNFGFGPATNQGAAMAHESSATEDATGDPPRRPGSASTATTTGSSRWPIHAGATAI